MKVRDKEDFSKGLERQHLKLASEKPGFFVLFLFFFFRPEWSTGSLFSKSPVSLRLTLLHGDWTKRSLENKAWVGGVSRVTRKENRELGTREAQIIPPTLTEATWD